MKSRCAFSAAMTFLLALTASAVDWFDAGIGSYTQWPPASGAVQNGEWTSAADGVGLSDLATLTGTAPTAALDIHAEDGDLVFGSSSLDLEKSSESATIDMTVRFNAFPGGKLPAVDPEAKAAVIVVRDGANATFAYLARAGAANGWTVSAVAADPSVSHELSVVLSRGDAVNKVTYRVDGQVLAEDVEVLTDSATVSKVKFAGSGSLSALSGTSVARQEPGPQGPDNAFRVTPYVQRPSPTAMTVMWLAQVGGEARLSYWKKGASEVTKLDAVARPELSQDVTGIRFAANDDALEYCEAPELGYDCSKNTSDNTKYRYDAWEMPYTVPYQYRARLTGLEPDTEYAYKVELPGATPYENSFRTPPSRDPESWRGLKFIYYSDSETEPADNDPVKGLTPDWTIPGELTERKYYVTQTEAYAKNIEEAMAFGTELIVMAGDLAQKGSKQCDWDEFWRHNAGPLNDPAGSVPIVASPGNHDYWDYGDGGECGLKKYMSYFEYEPNDAEDTDTETIGADQRERFHRVDYGPATFIFLDGNNGDDCPTNHEHDTNLSFTRADNGCRAPDFNPGSAQYRWLERQLADAQLHSAFTFIVTHHCPFSVGYHGKENYLYDPATGKDDKTNRDNLSGRPLRVLLPLLHKYGVDGWLAGHDEMMERSTHTGVETLPDGTEVPHTFSIWDMGIAGDGLRGNNFIENLYEAFRADVDSPEERDADGNLVYGGKHYGHLEVTIERDEEGYWKATFDPIYLLYRQNGTGKPTYVGKRHYADKQVRRSTRFRVEPVPANPVPVTETRIAPAAYVPTAKPQALVQTFYSDRLSRGFAWQTDRTVDEGKVWLLKGEYDETNDDLFDRYSVQVAEATCTPTPAQDEEANLYRAHVTGLASGETYSYRLGGKGQYAYGRFRVKDPASVTVLNFNDAQSKDAATLYRAENTLATAVRTLGGVANVDFAIFGGDLCDANALDNVNHATYGGVKVPSGGSMWQYMYWKWGLMVDILAPYLPGVPWIAVPGNHDYKCYCDVTEVDLFTAGLGNVGCGCSSVDYGKVHIAQLPYLDTWKNGSNRYENAFAWLDADLAQATDAKWKIVAVHWGPYTTGDHGQENGVAEMTRMLAPILSRHHVDLVLQAHDHTFSKSVPYRWGTLGYTDDAMDGTVLNLAPKTTEIDGETYEVNPRGTYYISCGCAGPRTAEEPDYPDIGGSKSYANRNPKIVMGKVNVASAYFQPGDNASSDFYRFSTATQNGRTMFGTLKIVGNRLAYDFYVAEEDGTATLVDTLRISKSSAGEGFLLLVK